MTPPSPRLAATRIAAIRLAATRIAAKRRGAGWALAALGFGLLGCNDVSRFDNSDGSAYCGNIVGASFVRKGFDHRPRLELQLNMSSLDKNPGRITTDDAHDGQCRPQPTFDAATLRISTELQSDPLSQLQFGDEREMNLLTWVDSSCDGTYLAVVSLLRNDDVEVRLMRSERTPDDSEAGPFGVFILKRHRTTCAFE